MVLVAVEENEQASAGRDGRIGLVRPNSQARTDRETFRFPCSPGNGEDSQPYSVHPYSAIFGDHISYIHHLKLKQSELMKRGDIYT